jgi:hypothetical protein
MRLVQVHQGTVDSYLENILSETIHATAKKQAVSALTLCTRVCHLECIFL